MRTEVIFRIIAVFLMLLLLFGLAGCQTKSDEAKIRDRIDKFVTSYNSGDMNGVFDSCSAKTRNTLKTQYDLLESLGGALLGDQLKLSDLFTLGVGLSDGDVLAVDINSVTVTGSTAVAKGTMHYQDIQSSKDSPVIFDMVKEGNDWFVKNMHD